MPELSPIWHERYLLTGARHSRDRAPRRTRRLPARGAPCTGPRPDADLAVQRGAVDAFLAAARNGDFEALLRVLDPDVVLRVDGGPNAPRASSGPPLVGAEAVARGAQGFRGAAPRAEPIIVNGAAGLLVRFPARSIVAAFTVVDGRIVEIDIIADPEKLRGLERDLGGR